MVIVVTLVAVITVNGGNRESVGVQCMVTMVTQSVCLQW